MVKKIPIAEALLLPNALFIDVRTPQEYAEDHIFGAINVPLLSDEERHEIGIIYKQQCREKAIEKGMELFPSKIPSIYNAVRDHKDKTIIVYCARGGMRSKIIASLLDSIGFKVLQVEGGYKSFRHYILDQLYNFQLKPKIVCLYGLTCTGKTKLLEHLPNSLNLEELAQHRGSLYGGVGLQPNFQKRFENLLLHRLRELNGFDHIFVEGESRRIGRVEIPDFLFRAMKEGTNVLVKRDFEKRVEEGVKEYFSSLEKVTQMKDITPQLRDIISKKRKEEIMAFIDAGKYHDAARIILKEYYDVLYEHTLKKVDFRVEITNNDMEEGIEGIEKKRKNK